MCFYIHHNHPNPIIAETDLICYKIGNNNKWFFFFNVFKPPYRSMFRYFLNIKTKKVKIVSRHNISIDEGYHVLINQGRTQGYDAGIFVIPKGTKFYFNPSYKECVSEQLIYKGPLTSVLYQKLLKEGCKKIYLKSTI